jgi:hypothetical protein
VTRRSKQLASRSIAKNLHTLAMHPPDLSWPTEQWPRDDASPETKAQADTLFNLEPHEGIGIAPGSGQLVPSRRIYQDGT